PGPDAAPYRGRASGRGCFRHRAAGSRAALVPFRHDPRSRHGTRPVAMRAPGQRYPAFEPAPASLGAALVLPAGRGPLRTLVAGLALCRAGRAAPFLDAVLQFFFLAFLNSGGSMSSYPRSMPVQRQRGFSLLEESVVTAAILREAILAVPAVASSLIARRVTKGRHDYSYSVV